MLKPLQETLNKLVGRKHELIRSFDKKQVEEETYKTELEDIESQIENERQKVIEERDKIQEEIEEAKTMGEEEKPKVETKKIGRKTNQNSYTMTIINVLKMKSIKDVDSAVEKVLEIKPGREKAKVRTQLKTIIGLVKKQKPARWTQYVWDEEKFLLSEK